MSQEPPSFTNLIGAELHHLDLTGAHLRKVRLREANLKAVDLAGVDIRGLSMTSARVRNAELFDVEIHAALHNVTINGIDVAPLILAEMDRRDPERVLMRPSDPAGFRSAWDLVETRWAQTVERARALDPALLHTSVDEEWSFIQTLRHLLFATDAWVRGALLGDPSPWHPLSLPYDEFTPTPGVPWDKEARPELDEVLELRTDRMTTVRRVIEGLTPERLAERSEPVKGLAAPGEDGVNVNEALLVILDEEWAHRRFAERDLAILESRADG